MTVELVKLPFWYLFNPVNYVQEGWCVRLGQEEIMWGWGNCLKYLNRGGTEKKQGETKILKKRKAGSRGQCLKRGAATPLEIMKIILPAYIKKQLRATLVAQVLSKTSVKKKKNQWSNRGNRCSKRVLCVLPSTSTQLHMDEMIIGSAFNYHKKILTTILTIVEEEPQL